MRMFGLAIASAAGFMLCVLGPVGADAAPQRPDAWKQLEQVVDLSDLHINTPLRQAIEIIRDSTTPRLNIVVLWRDITANTLITENSEIAMQGVSGITAGAGLDLVLRAVAAGPYGLGYTVEGGVVIVGTPANLPTRMYTRIYDISDLVAAPSYAQPGFGGFGGLGLGLGMFGNQGGYGGYGNPEGGYGNSVGGYGYGGYRGAGYLGGGYGVAAAPPGRSRISGPRGRNTTRAYAHVRRPSDMRAGHGIAGGPQAERRLAGPYNSAGEELAALIRASTMPRSGK